jgi:antitoxin (DNA-binding transcriptional repressor) of toxin-antitoxin stability system
LKNGHAKSKKRENENMVVVHITEAELARDLHAFIQQVRGGAEVVIEEEHHPVAVIKPAPVARRTLSELIRLAGERENTRGYAITLDDDFASDVDAVVEARKPWNPPAWD